MSKCSRIGRPAAGGEGVGGGHHVLDGIALHLLAAVRAEGVADAGEEQFQVVVYLGTGAHGAPRVAGHHLLFDGDGRADAGDAVHVRLLQAAHELAGIAAEAFDVPALAFRVKRIESQGALTGAAEAGDHHQLAPGDLQGDVLQVMHPGTLQADEAFEGAAEAFLGL
jgi:hypothetical protein